MCGCCGFLIVSESLPNGREAEAILAHDARPGRGSDGGRLWLDPEAGSALDHRRLAIRHCGMAESQPTRSHEGR